jgi:Ser/Thr protein kinase RdoA (MazF antagonist)
MNPDHLSKLAEEYDFGEVNSVTEVTEGILNRNYVLNTRNGPFFIKEVRQKSIELLPSTVLVEELMLERGISAICMLTSRSGKKFCEYDGLAYSVYPYIESDRSHRYTSVDYRNMGEMMAHIHRAGSYDIPELLTKNVYREKSKEGVLDNLKNYRERILAKQQDDTDSSFLEYIELKLSVIHSLAMEPVLESSTLVHGDFQTGNLLIDGKTRRITGICDWEKSEMEPRAHELARAVLYISFGGDYAEDTGVLSAQEILEGYKSVYPITREEVLAGFAVRLRRMVLTSWLENHYYDLSDPRGNHFVGHEMRLIKEFLLGDLLDKILISSTSFSTQK